MTILPAAFVFISGSQIIRDSAARWFSESVDEVLTAGQDCAPVLRRAATGDDAAGTAIMRLLPAGAVAVGNINGARSVGGGGMKTMRDAE